MYHLPDAWLLHPGLSLMVNFVFHRGKGRQAGSLFCDVRTPLELLCKCLPTRDMVLKIVMNCCKAVILPAEHRVPDQAMNAQHEGQLTERLLCCLPSMSVFMLGNESL